ncbi:MAG: hypothetical protein HY649_12160 [Acidobacteria bacterium]|nr:hypothetical protein [Acidobacteriota bacterium]
MLGLIRNICIFAVLVLLAGLRPAFAECTESNPSDCHIGSAALEINLGPLPVDHYLDHSNNRTPPVLPTNNCPVTSSIRSCIINYLKDYKNQGVTGVRFQFGLGGGGYSTAFDCNGSDNCNQPVIRRQWLNNLQMFFSDLARNVGIKNITPTPALGFWGGGDENFSSTQTVTSCGQSKTLLFMKWLPYGLRTDNYYPDCQGVNDAYEIGVSNPVFWGWQPFFNLMNAVLSRAAAQGLTVSELDVQNEVDLLNFTIQGRLINDNTTSTDVLATIRSSMNTYFGTGADARVTFSTTMSQPTSDGYDCGSVYGDTAMIATQSELTSGYARGLIGIPGGNFDNSNGLPCAGDTSGMFTFPNSYTQPTINDVHAYICIWKPGTNRCYDPTLDSLPANYGSATARNFYDGMWNFFVYRGFTGHKAMIGETNHMQNLNGANDPCWSELSFDLAMAYSNANGFNGYSGTSSSLYQNAASNTVIRPWENDLQKLEGTQQSCYIMPNTISPPYTP